MKFNTSKLEALVTFRSKEVFKEMPNVVICVPGCYALGINDMNIGFDFYGCGFDRYLDEDGHLIIDCALEDFAVDEFSSDWKIEAELEPEEIVGLLLGVDLSITANDVAEFMAEKENPSRPMIQSVISEITQLPLDLSIEEDSVSRAVKVDVVGFCFVYTLDTGITINRMLPTAAIVKFNTEEAK